MNSKRGCSEIQAGRNKIQIRDNKSKGNGNEIQIAF